MVPRFGNVFGMIFRRNVRLRTTYTLTFGLVKDTANIFYGTKDQVCRFHLRNVTNIWKHTVSVSLFLNILLKVPAVYIERPVIGDVKWSGVSEEGFP